ncbi:MAG: hypothetical protein Q8O89_00835 [Nanoarchaeota archaeon]|nr:hypothetical protein [Nanoarchaeota archaeon]
MTLINLTQQYLSKGNPSLIDKVKLHFIPDLCWSDSLSDIESYFRENPPKKKDIVTSELGAYIIMNYLKVKRLENDIFDESDGVSLQGLDEGFCYPFFVVSDKVTRRLAFWNAGDSSKYIQAKEDFGFNSEKYVTIPKVFLVYIPDANKGMLMIADFDRKDTLKREEQKEGLMDKILSAIPAMKVPIVQPGY